MSLTLVIYIIILVSTILRPITIALHELGHAIPALIFTNDNVKIYIGSYKELEKSKKLKIGRLKIFIKYNPLQFTGGLCESYGFGLSKTKQIIILASGSIFVFVTAFSLTLTSIGLEWADIPKSLIIIFLLSSIYDLFIDLVPNKKPVVILEGINVYNDGQAILNVIRQQKEKYKFIDSSFIEKENLKSHPVNHSFEFFQTAFDKFKKGDNEGAISDYTKAIDIYDQSPVYYNNRGYSYILLNEYEKSIIDFNRAIDLDNKFAYAFNNRGFSFLMLDKLEDGLTDILKSLSLDKGNSYAIRNLGIYYFKKGEYKKAREYLNKAFNMDNETPLVNDYLIKLTE